MGANGISIGEVSIYVQGTAIRYGKSLSGNERVFALREWRLGSKNYAAFTWNPLKEVTPNDVYWATADPFVAGCDCKGKSHRVDCETFK